MKNINEVITDPKIFLDELFRRLEEVGFNADPYFMDHICFRVGTPEEYETKKVEMAALGNLLVESMVNGRMIATYKLHSPIAYKNRLIDVVELPAPKPGSHYESGLEHVEFVTTENLHDFVKKHPGQKFETGGIDKKFNADITLRLGDYCIRFHNQTLEEVIEIEKGMANV